MKTQSAKKKVNSIKKSLTPAFDKLAHKENIFRSIHENNLPSEDPSCNKNLEELISSIQNYDNDKKHTNDLTDQVINEISNEQPQNSMTDQVHMILFSKANLNEIKSETDDTDSEEKVASDSKFYSFDHDDYFDLLLEENEHYELTDYSSNSSSNNGSYIWREEEEGPFKEAPPNTMFQLFKNVHFNDVHDDSGVAGLQSTKPILQKLPNQQNSKFFLNKFNSTNEDIRSITNTNCNNPFGSQLYSQHSNSLIFGNNNSQGLDCILSGSNTMVNDFNYFLKNQIKEQITGPNTNMANEKRLSRIMNSPTKPKVKRIYCNEKRIPLWATNIDEVAKTSCEQKKLFKTNLIFGTFHVENLNLEEIFNARRFARPR